MWSPPCVPWQTQTPPIRQCAVLVGGLGTRLGPLAAAAPKPMLPCGDRPFLAWLLRETMREGVTDFLLLAGHMAAAVRDGVPDLRRHLPPSARIEVVEEPVRAGTGGAVFHARTALDDRFLLCNGDSMLESGLGRLLAAADCAAAGADGDNVAGRIVLRHLPDTTRYGVVQTDGDRVTAFSERPQPGLPGLINGGIYLFRRSVADAMAPVCSLERDVLPHLAAQGALRGTAADGWFIDIGVPDDYARAQTELPRRLRRPALLLDRDGVINLDHGWVGTRDRFDWVDGAREAIATATARGWAVFVVTNQSGVARGLYTEAQLQALHAWMVAEIRQAGGTIDDIRYCPYHEEAVVPEYRRASDWRKPAPGMILDLIAAWQLDPARCLMVGDSQRDLDAAAAAGIASRLFPGGNLAAFLDPLLAAHDLRIPA